MLEKLPTLKSLKALAFHSNHFNELPAAGESFFTGGRHYLLVKSNSPESLFTGK